MNFFQRLFGKKEESKAVMRPVALAGARFAKRPRFNRTTTFNLATKSNPEHIRYIPVPRRHAGMRIDHDTALTFSAVYRAIAYISSQIAILPWEVLLEADKRTKKLVSHNAYRLLKTRANPELGAFSFRETIVGHALAWGNGYAEIERDRRREPIALWPITPDRVSVRRNPETGGIEYVVSNYYGPATVVAPENMFHLRGLGFDGLVGYSVVSLGARSIGLGLAAESFGEDFFANGAVSTGALKHPRVLSNEAKARMREDLNAVAQGAGKRFNIPIFEEGMEWVDMMINPEDAQLLLTRQFQVTDVARWFGLPPHKLADLTRSTHNNIEHQNIEVKNDALMPWVRRLEEEADYKLLNPNERGVRTKFNFRGFLRGDDKSRAEYYKIMREIGVYTTDDILKLEDMDLIGGEEGSARIVPGGYQTLRRMIEGPSEPVQQTEQVEEEEDGETEIEEQDN